MSESRGSLAARLTGDRRRNHLGDVAVFGRIDPHLRRSITFDNDTAFAQHGLLRTMRDMTTLVAATLTCLMAKRQHRKRQWTLTSMAAAPRLDIDRTSDQDIQEIVLTTSITPMPRVQDAIPSLDCRAWKGRSNPLLLNALRFATESRTCKKYGRSRRGPRLSAPLRQNAGR